MPQVSIGMPVYNAESTVGSAITSLLAQTLADFELIISDNASTDHTGDICRTFAEHDSRVCYVRQPTNQGAARNFDYVLQRATAPLFMWAGGDDFWLPTFVERNRDALVNDPELVLSISRVQPHVGDWNPPHEAGTDPIIGDFRQRLRQYLTWPGSNSRFYGLLRREQIKRAYVMDRFMASDWATMVNLLRFGNSHEVPEVLMIRGTNGESGRGFRAHFRALGMRWPQTSLPLVAFDWWLWRNVEMSDFLAVLWPLFYVNARFAKEANREMLRQLRLQFRHPAP